MSDDDDDEDDDGLSMARGILMAVWLEALALVVFWLGVELALWFVGAA